MFHFRFTDGNVIKSLKWFLVIFNAVILFMVCLYCFVLPSREHVQRISVESSLMDQSAGSHSFRKNIYFLKTHKTASSTVQNIIMRVGLRHSLNFILPKFLNYIGFVAPLTDDDLDQATIPVDHKFNAFVHHSRYNIVSNHYLYEDTIKVTILRDPPKQYESVYQFYRLDTVYNMSLRQLLLSLPHTNVTSVRKTRLLTGYNLMSFALGLDPRAFDNETAIRVFIDYVDQQFDYVMINEYLDASLIMLADLMGWPLYYVTSLPLMARDSQFKYHLNVTEKMKLAQLNNADTMLYHHFLDKFRVRVMQYGITRLIESIRKLQTMNEDLANRCILRTNNNGYRFTRSYELKNPTDWECVYSTKLELDFTDELRRRQVNRLRSIQQIYELVNQTHRM